MFFLGGGFKKFCYFHQDPWVNDLILLIIFQMGLKPPTSYGCFQK